MKAMPKEKTLTLGDIAQKSGGTLQGPCALSIMGLCSLDESESGCITFLRETNASKVKTTLSSTKASAAFVSESLKGKLADSPKPIIFVAKPQEALFALVPYFFNAPSIAKNVSARADVDPSATLGANVAIGAFSCIGPEVSVGDNTTIHPHVCIYPRARIGKNCLIHAGAVIREDCVIGDNCTIQPGAIVGSDGFGYVSDSALGLKPIPQVGHVLVERGVDIGANACIDRAALGTTRVGPSTKIDNLVQIGHNTKIGKAVILCGQVGIAGSCDIADHVVLGGATGVADHVKIVSGVRAGGRSGITSDILKSGDYMGHPAMPASLWRRIVTILPRLPKLLRTIKGSQNAHDDE